MSFESLSSQFNNILTQYQNTYQAYLNSLDTSDNSLITSPNTLFTGEGQLSVEQSSTVDNCQASCSTNASCSGASFNTTNNNCTLSSGSGSLSNSTENTSFVEPGIYYSYQLQLLNEQLMSINQQMMQSSTASQGTFQQNQQQTQQSQQILNQNYETLQQERSEIARMVREYQTLNQAYDNGTINTNSSYAQYIVLLLVTILLVFLLIKFSITSGSQYGGGKRPFYIEAGFLLGIMIIFLCLSNVYKNYDGYMFVSIILIAYIIAKIKLNN